jgi:TetR/AcrR family transcriptional regulator, transcriptional repressor for nem operon
MSAPNGSALITGASEPLPTDAGGPVQHPELNVCKMVYFLLSSESRNRYGELLMNAKSTRDQLIDTGLDLMYRHGFNATGLTEILRKANVPKGSFYHFFGSKEEFAGAALEKYAAQKAEHSAAILGDAAVSPLTRLKRYFVDLVSISGQHGPIPGCLLGRFSLEVAADSPQLRKRISASFGRWQHAIATVIEQAVAQEELPADTNAEALAGFILNNWEGALLRSQADKSDAPLESFVHYVFDELLAKRPKRKADRKATATH